MKFNNLIKILLLLIISNIYAEKSDNHYFQQFVKYNIEATLNDSDHTLNANLKLDYTNNSPDALDYIWFHLWPNAYKNNTSAFAKQQLRLGRTNFYFDEEKNKGLIDSLNFKVDNKNVKMEFHPEWNDVAKVVLNKPLNPGETIKIETPFFLKIPKVYSRLGHTGKHYEMTQWYPKPAVYDKDGWHEMPYLNMGEFYSEFGEFDVKITLPKDYVIMATGDLINGEKEYEWLDSLAKEGSEFLEMTDKEIKKWVKEEKKSKNKKPYNWFFNWFKKDKKVAPPISIEYKTLHFHQKDVHDFAWFADKKYIVQKGELELPNSKNKVTLWSMYLPKNAVLWKHSIEYLHDSGWWYSKFYGDYPFKHITAVDGDLSAGGGMEYPNITVIAKMSSRDLLEMVIMHEVGHNWFYGILGTNERDHAWMDEGINEYSNIRYWEKKYGMDSGMQVTDKFGKYFILRNNTFRWMNSLGCQRQCFRRDAQIIDQHSDNFKPGNYGSMVYSKTGALTRYLQEYLGEQKMDEIMQDYFETWKFKHPSPQDYRNIFKKHTDKNLDWYFEDGLNTIKNIDLAIFKKKNKFYLQNNGEIEIPGYVEFYNSENERIGSEWVEGFKNKIQLKGHQNSKYAILDPQNNMFDINPTNHTTCKKGISLPLFFDQPDFHAHYLGTISPSFTINSENFGIGPNLRRGSNPTENLVFSITPSYDILGNQYLIESTIGWQEFRIFGLDKIRSDVGFFKTQSRETIKSSAEIIFREPIVRYPFLKIDFDVDMHFKLPEIYNLSEEETRSHRLDIFYKNKKSAFTNYSFKSNISFVKQGIKKYSSISLNGELNNILNKKIKIESKIQVKKVIDDGLIPWLPRIGGSIDPDYGNYVWGREITGDFSVNNNQYINSDPSARIAPNINSIYNFAVGVDLELEGLLPVGNLYVDYLFVNQSENYLIQNSKNYSHIFSTGFSISMGFVKIHFPVYMSWENPLKLTIESWTNYLRPEVNLDINELIRNSLR